ncbi:OTOGL protein, partial [Polypterus senegalus]
MLNYTDLATEAREYHWQAHMRPIEVGIRGDAAKLTTVFFMEFVLNQGQDRDGICRSWGLYHFETFDGIYYYFPGRCSYILAKDCHSTEPQYTIWVHNSRDCNSSVYSCPRSLSLFFHNEEEIHIVRHEVKKGGRRLSLPITIRHVFIERLADYILVKSTFGFSLAWDGGTGVYIKMSEEHKEQPCGLCGNFNDNALDDLTTSYTECSVTGDTHVTSFDGRIFMLVGTCQYILVKSWRTSKFTVILQNMPCGEALEQSCIQSVILVVDEDVNKQVTLTRDGEVLIGINQAANLPYIEGDIEIRKITSLFIQIKTHFGLRIQFDGIGGRLYLQVESSWKGGTLGLCGTFNGNLRDDFLSPSGMIEGTPQLHTNAWKVSSACTSPLNIPLIDPCEMNQQNGMICLGGMQYHSCTSTCGNTCHALSKNEECNDDCAEGCNCPLGTYFDEVRQRCVTDLCRNGRMECAPEEPDRGRYRSLEPLSTTPDTSVCQRGFFNCTHYPCPAVCTVYSDRHYHTFDGLEYDYVSDCQVYLIKSNNGTEVSVTAENQDCYESGIICMKHLTIFVGSSKIYFNDNSGKPSSSSVIGRGYEFQLWKAGYYTVLHFPKQEITILWDTKTTVHIQAGPQWKGQLTGMCGNFDKITVNDMTTSSNIEVSNAQAFGDSWALGQCESDYVVKRPCEGDLIRQPYAKRECAILYSDVFTPCHNVVRLPVVSFESAERPNYFLCASEDGSLRLEQWSANEDFRKEATFLHHQGLWMPGYSSFELYNQKGFFVTLTRLLVRAVMYDNTEEFKHISSFTIEDMLLYLSFNYLFFTGIVLPPTPTPYMVVTRSNRTTSVPSTTSRTTTMLTTLAVTEMRITPVKATVSEQTNATATPEYTTARTTPMTTELSSSSSSIMTTSAVTSSFVTSTDILTTLSSVDTLITLATEPKTAKTTQIATSAHTPVSTVSTEQSISVPYVSTSRSTVYLAEAIQTTTAMKNRTTEFAPVVQSTTIAVTTPHPSTATTFPLSTEEKLSSSTALRAEIGSSTSQHPQTMDLETKKPSASSTSTTETEFTTASELTTLLLSSTTSLPSPSVAPIVRTTLQTTTDFTTYESTLPVTSKHPFTTIHNFTTTESETTEIVTSEAITQKHTTAMALPVGTDHTTAAPPSTITSPAPDTISTFIPSLLQPTSTCTVSINFINGRLPFTRQSLHIDDTGTMYVINTPGGVSIQWYHSTGIIVLQYNSPYNTTSGTQGLCGCCDGNPADDLKLPNGTIIKNVEDIPIFLYSWMVNTSEETDYFRRVGYNLCTDNEGRPRAPGEVWNGSNKGCCMYRCMENGSVIAVEPDCSEVPAPICEREGEYVIDVIEEGACCPKKICECNLTICDNEVPTCENGNKLMIGYSTISCCPEYRCVCESCIDPIPVCNEGEILAVDLNTTQQCCPQYHCEKADVCLFQGITMLSPGQSMIQYFEGDLCHTVQCLQEIDLTTGFHSMDVVTVNCSEKCGELAMASKQVKSGEKKVLQKVEIEVKKEIIEKY